MFPHSSFPASFVSASWLLPAVERQRGSQRPQSAPPLAPRLSQRLLLGLLAACKHHLRHVATPLADDVGLAALPCQHDEESNALSTLALNRQSTIWLTWLEETELRLALRVLLAPASPLAAPTPGKPRWPARAP